MTWSASSAVAAWQVNGNVVRFAYAVLGIVDDGSGGVMIAWNELETGTTQRVSASGDLVFAINGQPISNAALSGPCASDGAGGMFVPFIEGTTLHVTHAVAAGNAVWDAVVCSAAAPITNPYAVSDGNGGAFVTWAEQRSGNYDAYKVYCQRIGSDGQPLWTANGVLVKWETWYPPHFPQPQGQAVWPLGIVLSGSGGAIVVWYTIDDLDQQPRLGASRVDDPGSVLNTNEVGTPFLYYLSKAAVVSADGSGGAYVAADNRIFKTSPAGALIWDRIFSNLGNFPFIGSVVSDGTGGVITTWSESRNGSSSIYAQRFSAAGVPQWINNGVAVCEVAAKQLLPAATPDGAGGVYVAWEDERNDSGDIYAQRIDANGSPAWTTDGVPVCLQQFEQTNPHIQSFSDGYAIVAWNGNGIRAQRLNFDSGALAVAIGSFDARAVVGRVVITATFRSDLGVDFVRVYRGEEGQALALRDELVSAHGERFEYVDASVEPGRTYRYQIGVGDGDGEFLSPVQDVSLPRIVASLHQNQPNPFNPSTAISFSLAAREHATILIYDANGMLVRTLLDATEDAGDHQVEWDGRDANGVIVGSGVYFYRLTAGKHAETKKMVLLK